MTRLLALVTLTVALTACTDTPAPLAACPTEDSVSCYWDASTRGNHLGRSFTADADGTQHFTS